MFFKVAFYRAVDPVINPTENDDNGYNGRKDACGWWATSVVSSRQWDQPLTEKRWRKYSINYIVIQMTMFNTALIFEYLNSFYFVVYHSCHR